MHARVNAKRFPLCSIPFLFPSLSIHRWLFPRGGCAWCREREQESKRKRKREREREREARRDRRASGLLHWSGGFIYPRVPPPVPYTRLDSRSCGLKRWSARAGRLGIPQTHASPLNLVYALRYRLRRVGTRARAIQIAGPVSRVCTRAGSAPARGMPEIWLIESRSDDARRARFLLRSRDFSFFFFFFFLSVSTRVLFKHVPALLHAGGYTVVRKLLLSRRGN